MGFRINPPPAPELPVTNAPPTIDSTPAPPDWTIGDVAVYDMSQHVTDDDVTPLVYSLIPTLTPYLSINSVTGVVSYDGGGSAGSIPYQLVVDDGVNSPVTSLPFNIVLVEPVITPPPDPDPPAPPPPPPDPDPVGTDYIHSFHPWTHLLEPIGVIPDDFFLDGKTVWGRSSSPTMPEANGTGFWIDDGTRSVNGLMVAGTRQFHTNLTNNLTYFRTERSHQREPRNIKCISVGTHFDPILNSNIEQFQAPQKYWYGFILRIDRADDLNGGYYCQWHTNAAKGGSPVLALQMRADGLLMYLEKNPDFNGNYKDNKKILVVPNATLFGVTRAYIWEILWDTRHESMGSEGIVRLYVDDNPTPAAEWINKNNNQQAGVGTPAEVPYFKYGLYKSGMKSRGTVGDVHVQQHTNFTVMGEGGSRLGMLDAVMFDQIL